MDDILDLGEYRYKKETGCGSKLKIMFQVP